MSELPDDSLVERVGNGEQQALLHLYDRYASRVYALALRILGDSMSAEEITQDVFLKLWSRARSYLAERGPLAPWLLTIARNTALDRLRLERRRPAITMRSRTKPGKRFQTSGLPRKRLAGAACTLPSRRSPANSVR